MPMPKNRNRAAGGSQGAADCDAQQNCSQFNLDAAKIKAPTGSESRRLAASRYTSAIPQTAMAAAFLKALARKAALS